MELEIVATDAPDPSVREVIRKGLKAFNEERGGPSKLRHLALLIREPK